MDARQIEVVNRTWVQLRADADAFSVLFYRRLFENDPALRVLFPENLTEQRGKLVDMLQAVVDRVRDPDTLYAILFDLGARHVGYGVVESDYHAVANALLEAIEAQLGAAFSAEVREAWSQAFRVLAQAMLDGARSVPEERAVLTPRQRRLVQGSWNLLRAKAGMLSRMFYGGLFERDPSLRTLFAADTTIQRGRFVSSLSFAINGLDNLEELRPVVEALGRRHVGYGVRPSDYDVAACALLSAVARCLGSWFTPELQSAWTETYGVLARMMQDGSMLGEFEATPPARP